MTIGSAARKATPPGRLALAMASLSILATPAMAGPYQVRRAAVQLAMPTMASEERTYRVGETILDMPILWLSAATLRSPVLVEADGQSEQLAAGTVLPAQLLAEANGPTTIAFCTVRRPAERASEHGIGAALLGGVLTRRLVQTLTDRQVCLLDTDGDGQADHSLIVGDGTPAARTPRPIPAAPWDVAELVPISSQDRVWVELTGIGRGGNSLQLNIHVEQLGRDRVFDVMSGRWGRAERRSRVRLMAGQPTETVFLGVDLLVMAASGSDRSVQLRWTPHHDLDRAVVIPDGLTYVAR